VLPSDDRSDLSDLRRTESDGLGPVVNFGMWRRPWDLVRMRPELEPIEDSIADGRVERYEFEGIELVRWVHRAEPREGSTVWRSIPEACEFYGITSRCILQRIKRGWMRKRFGPRQIEVAAVAGVTMRSNDRIETITAVPTNDRGRDPT